MEKVTILQFRRDAEAVIRKVRQGKSLILTYRGKPVMRLEPIQERVVDPEDPLYTLSELAASDGRPPDERSLTNEEIDKIVYES
jgi:prevent-host-death family protein